MIVQGRRVCGDPAFQLDRAACEQPGELTGERQGARCFGRIQRRFMQLVVTCRARRAVKQILHVSGPAGPHRRAEHEPARFEVGRHPRDIFLRADLVHLPEQELIEMIQHHPQVAPLPAAKMLKSTQRGFLDRLVAGPCQRMPRMIEHTVMSQQQDAGAGDLRCRRRVRGQPVPGRGGTVRSPRKGPGKSAQHIRLNQYIDDGSGRAIQKMLRRTHVHTGRAFFQQLPDLGGVHVQPECSAILSHQIASAGPQRIDRRFPDRAEQPTHPPLSSNKGLRGGRSRALPPRRNQFTVPSHSDRSDRRSVLVPCEVDHGGDVVVGHEHGRSLLQRVGSGVFGDDRVHDTSFRENLTSPGRRGLPSWCDDTSSAAKPMFVMPAIPISTSRFRPPSDGGERRIHNDGEPVNRATVK